MLLISKGQTIIMMLMYSVKPVGENQALKWKSSEEFTKLPEKTLIL